MTENHNPDRDGIRDHDGAESSAGPRPWVNPYEQSAQSTQFGSTAGPRKQKRRVPLVPAVLAGSALFVVGGLAGGAIGVSAATASNDSETSQGPGGQNGPGGMGGQQGGGGAPGGQPNDGGMPGGQSDGMAGSQSGSADSGGASDGSSSERIQFGRNRLGRDEFEWKRLRREHTERCVYRLGTRYGCQRIGFERRHNLDEYERHDDRERGSHALRSDVHRIRRPQPGRVTNRTPRYDEAPTAIGGGFVP
jgi:hypothetical protein